jgi:hypothetical protein
MDRFFTDLPVPAPVQRILEAAGVATWVASPEAPPAA